MNVFSTEAICRANSLVGNTIKALCPTTLECALSLFTKGITNAAVFPEPVREQATTSLPSKTCGLNGISEACNPSELAMAEAYFFTQDMNNRGFTVNLHPCPSTGGEVDTNIMYSWCLISAWGDTNPTIGTNTKVGEGTDNKMDCLTSQSAADSVVTKGGKYHSGATCMFMEIT